MKYLKAIGLAILLLSAWTPFSIAVIVLLDRFMGGTFSGSLLVLMATAAAIGGALVIICLGIEWVRRIREASKPKPQKKQEIPYCFRQN